MTEYNEMTRNKVKAAENYIEKYQPLFTQRQINEALDYVLNVPKFQARVAKYAELKQEYLIDKILKDNGAPDLMSKQKVMDRLISTGLPPPEESEMQQKLSGVAVVPSKVKSGDASDEEQQPLQIRQKQASSQEADGPELDKQITGIVGALIEQKLKDFEDKLKYWNTQVQANVDQNFKQQSAYLLEQISMLQAEIQESHLNHIQEINSVRDMKSEGVVLSKEAVTRLVALESKYAAHKAVALEMCYLCESLNQLLYTQVK